MATATHITNVDTEVYGGFVAEEYEVNDFFGTTGMVYFSARPTETINIPVMQKGATMYLADGGAHTREDASMTAVELALNTPLKAQNRIPRSDVDVRPDLRLLENYGRQHGRDIAQTKTKHLISYLSKVALDAGNVVYADTDHATNAAVNTKNGIKEIMANMDDLEVTAGRNAFLKPSEFYELADQDGVMSRDFGGQANRQMVGGNFNDIKYLNTLIRESGVGFGTDFESSGHVALGVPAAYRENLTNVVGVFWQADAWALREQTQIESEVSWIPENQAWLVLSRYHFGTASILSDGIWVLVNGTA